MNQMYRKLQKKKKKKSIFSKKRGISIPRRKIIWSAEIPWDFSPGGGSDMYAACDDHFSKMQNTARNDHLKKKSLGFVCRNNFFAVDIAKHDSLPSMIQQHLIELNLIISK